MDEAARYRWMAVQILPWEAELRAWLRQHLRSANPSDIDDLVQEVFARIWATDFAPIRNGRAYLYATLRHLLVEQARHRRIVPIELLGEIESLNLISEAAEPERQVSARQELERLHVIVAELPRQCRRVFELRKFQGLSHTDIASRLGLRAKTVENHLTRALARIVEALASEEQGREPSRRRAPSRRGRLAHEEE